MGAGAGGGGGGMAAAVVEETCLGLAANAEVLALLRARAEEAGGESELSGGDRRLLEYLQGVSAPPGESPPPPPLPKGAHVTRGRREKRQSVAPPGPSPRRASALPSPTDSPAPAAPPSGADHGAPPDGGLHGWAGGRRGVPTGVERTLQSR